MPHNPNKPFDRRNISRIVIEETDDKSSTYGWQVRFTRKGKQISQFFSDSGFGSEEKSLEAAKMFRDAMEIELGVGKVPKGYNGERSKSGIVGVRRVKSTSKKSYGTYHYYFWEAAWTSPSGKRKTKKFPISSHGEEEALRLAIEARQQGLKYRQKIDNPLFAPPEDEDVRIWRYMDFTKFVSMLENQGLFFPCAENLGDPFEGSFSSVNKNLRPLIRKHSSKFIEDSDVGELVKKLRSWVAISCWHMSNHESAGMWKLYAKTPEAVCIQSTFNRLRRCLPSNVEIGTVHYVDYLSDWIPESHLLAPFMYKRMSFEHEREIRALINLAKIEIDIGKLDDIKGEPPLGG
jgi:hypothetical protein